MAPHDINDLVALYEKAGQINEKEQDTIVMNPRGKAFLMTGAYSRTNIDIIVADRVRDLFEKIRKDTVETELEDQVTEENINKEINSGNNSEGK